LKCCFALVLDDEQGRLLLPQHRWHISSFHEADRSSFEFGLLPMSFDVGAKRVLTAISEHSPGFESLSLSSQPTLIVTEGSFSLLGG
jgi:hypothetical protein